MSGGAGQPLPRADGTAWRRVLREAGGVLLAGGVFALAANGLSPRGLKLTRDYFPSAVTAAAASAPATATAGRNPATNRAAESAQAVVARLRAKGLHPIGLPQVEQLYHEPGYAQELTIFVDARNDEHYQAGHLPGAYQFDHYHPERYIATVLPACQAAQQIVVYCTGGDCEDSEFAALTLSQAGVPLDKLSVFVGGFTEWSAHDLPVELGARNSGQWRPTKP